MRITSSKLPRQGKRFGFIILLELLPQSATAIAGITDKATPNQVGNVFLLFLIIGRRAADLLVTRRLIARPGI